MGELDRLQIMTRIAERRLTRRRAAALLGLSERQVRRLYRAFRRDGAKGVVSRHRGRPSNRQLVPETRDQALTLVRERYADFGPTFAHQKLTEEHALAFCVETLRGWMTAAGLWIPRAQRSSRSGRCASRWVTAFGTCKGGYPTCCSGCCAATPARSGTTPGRCGSTAAPRARSTRRRLPGSHAGSILYGHDAGGGASRRSTPMSVLRMAVLPSRLAQ